MSPRSNHEEQSANSSIGINSRKEAEKNLVTSPYSFWHYLDLINLPSDSSDILSGDIGYDTRSGMVIVGTVGRASGTDKGILDLQQLSFEEDKYDDYVRPRPSFVPLMRHELDRSDLNSTSTLQLWRGDSIYSDTSKMSLSHYMLYASITTLPDINNATELSDRTVKDSTAANKSSDLQTC